MIMKCSKEGLQSSSKLAYNSRPLRQNNTQPKEIILKQNTKQYHK